MKRLKIMVVIGILGAFGLAMVAIGSASAGRPVQSTDYADFDWTFEECVQNGEPVIIPGHLTNVFTLTVFFDHDGNPTSWFGRELGTATLTYNGRTFTMHNAFESTGTWPDDNQTLMEERGIIWLGTVPGHGPIVGIAGKQTSLETCTPDGEDCETELIEFSGIDFTDYEALCNYMLYGE